MWLLAMAIDINVDIQRHTQHPFFLLFSGGSYVWCWLIIFAAFATCSKNKIKVLLPNCQSGTLNYQLYS